MLYDSFMHNIISTHNKTQAISYRFTIMLIY